jgi:hypothetical protein
MGPSLLTPPNHSTVAGGATPGRAAGGNEPAGRETKGAAQGHCWPISHRAVNGYERRSTSHRPSAGRRRPDRTACESGSEVARPCDDGPCAVPFPNSEDFRIDWLSARTSDRRKVRLNRVRLVTCVSSPTRTRTWNKPVNSRACTHGRFPTKAARRKSLQLQHSSCNVVRTAAKNCGEFRYWLRFLGNKPVSRRGRRVRRGGPETQPAPSGAPSAAGAVGRFGNEDSGSSLAAPPPPGGTPASRPDAATTAPPSSSWPDTVGGCAGWSPSTSTAAWRPGWVPPTSARSSGASGRRSRWPARAHRRTFGVRVGCEHFQVIGGTQGGRHERHAAVNVWGGYRTLHRPSILSGQRRP